MEIKNLDPQEEVNFFIKQNLIFDEDAELYNARLLQFYKKWCSNNNYPIRDKALVESLSQMDNVKLVTDLQGKTSIWHGVCL